MTVGINISHLEFRSPRCFSEVLSLWSWPSPPTPIPTLPIIHSQSKHAECSAGRYNKMVYGDQHLISIWNSWLIHLSEFRQQSFACFEDRDCRFQNRWCWALYTERRLHQLERFGPFIHNLGIFEDVSWEGRVTVVVRKEFEVITAFE